MKKIQGGIGFEVLIGLVIGLGIFGGAAGMGIGISRTVAKTGKCC